MLIKRYSTIVLLQFSSMLLLCCPNVSAQTPTESPQSHERLYQVELIVFARAEANTQEHWPSDLKLIYPENLISLKAEGNSTEGLSLLPATERALNSLAASLAKSGSYTLLYHQAWRQMIYGRKTNIAISGGKSFGNHQELEGNIAVSVAQYLKIQTNLWLTQFAPAGTNLTEVWPELPSPPNTFNSEGEKNQNYVIKRIIKVNQERSMRSNEIHYIDHPLMGIIVKIVPIEIPSTKTN
jgi:hypothetical protein